jgi:hypothetical protein
MAERTVKRTAARHVTAKAAALNVIFSAWRKTVKVGLSF